MGINKRLLKYIIPIAVIIVSLFLVLFFTKFKKSSSNPHKEFTNISLFSGVPSDAIMVFYFDCLSNYDAILKDTTSFAYGLFESKNPLVKLQLDLISYDKISNIPFVYSLHYSAKNTVSFLEILDFKDCSEMGQIFDKIKNTQGVKSRDYNNVKIYSYANGLNFCFKGSLLLASNSSFILESSIRHFANGTSILDNNEAYNLVTKINGSTLLINNKQIGKFFSGEVAREFLGYSDFFHNFSNWSIFNLSLSKGLLNLDGYFDDGKSVKNFTNIIYSQQVKKTDVYKYLPATSVFSMFFNFSSITKFTQVYDLYLDINKKLGRKQQARESYRRENMLSQSKWLDSLSIQELGAVYCKFGDKCEWITFLKDNVKDDGSIGKLVNSVIGKKDEIKVLDYKYKGYISSTFGDLFSHCNEEAFCKIGQWMIIGPKNIIKEFAQGNAYYYSFEDYIKQTPASSIVNREAFVKSVINLKESPDTIINIFKPYLAARLKKNIDLHNFELITTSLENKDGKINADINFYATNLTKLPVPRIKADNGVDSFIVIDSTIHISKGPFEVYDATRKSKGYFEQLPNNRLRLCGPNMKGIWAIPFENPLSGNVEQVDYFNNGKNQMMFIAGNKLYLLDMLARFVRGYPVSLEKQVVLGPFIIKGTSESDVTFMVLNEDNTISRYYLNGKKVKGWNDIKASEFIKELPVLMELGDNKYWVLKLPSQLKLYNYNGTEINIPDKKIKIDRDSEVEYIGKDELKLKNQDGKYFIFNLSTLKTKKVK